MVYLPTMVVIVVGSSSSGSNDDGGNVYGTDGAANRRFYP